MCDLGSGGPGDGYTMVENRRLRARVAELETRLVWSADREDSLTERIAELKRERCLTVVQLEATVSVVEQLLPVAIHADAKRLILDDLRRALAGPGEGE